MDDKAESGTEKSGQPGPSTDPAGHQNASEPPKSAREGDRADPVSKKDDDDDEEEDAQKKTLEHLMLLLFQKSVTIQDDEERTQTAETLENLKVKWRERYQPADVHAKATTASLSSDNLKNDGAREERDLTDDLVFVNKASSDDIGRTEGTVPGPAHAEENKRLDSDPHHGDVPESTSNGESKDKPSKNYLVQKAESAEARMHAAPRGSAERVQALNDLLHAESELKEQEAKPDASANQQYGRMKSFPKKDAQQDGPAKHQMADSGDEHGLDRQSSETQESGAGDENPGSRSWRDSLNGLLSQSAQKNGQDAGDLEAGTMGKPEKAKEKEYFDVHVRKRIFAPRRKDRIVDQVPRKVNYGPGAVTLPQPTYLDRQGRTELEVFQALVGVHFLSNAGAPIDWKAKTIEPTSVMSDIFLPSRAAANRHRNRGLYDRCISQDMKMRVMYSFSHYMISFLYLLQILVAATLTGLSSYSDTAGVAITALGAINTVLAGILAWLNGQGMPVRYRRSRDQFREVVRAIEDAERMFSTIDYMDWPQGTRPTPLGERDKLFQMYEKARQDQEANYPDTHEDANKTEVANRTKDMEAKIEKHKKQKKAKDEELKKALAKLEKKQTPKSGGVPTKSDESEATAVDSNQDDDIPSRAELDEKLERLEIQQSWADGALHSLAKQRNNAKAEHEIMKQEIKKLCTQGDVDEQSVREKVQNKVKDSARRKR
ncbi:hypothetical protein D0867_04574 [Hortaea werneckii]|uniref:SMODS and SLOG-associating 2TM effector domain-containing protein n=1 Tax=Hortaea werneckii TaxID=91943 RepID=A0A3M6ZWK0_HORWE|nr:hypothetical protein D0867_04574 [Hortaea werneckii]